MASKEGFEEWAEDLFNQELTKAAHGGKITCHKCSALLTEDAVIMEFEGVHFHVDCFNRYEHYYGLDKPID